MAVSLVVPAIQSHWRLWSLLRLSLADGKELELLLKNLRRAMSVNTHGLKVGVALS